MRSLALCIVVLMFASASGGVAQMPSATANPQIYGQYPIAYKEIITRWLGTKLLDPASAQIEWLNEPKAADLVRKGQHNYGYLVELKVNSRNRFGAYTGKQKYTVLLRNGEIVKADGFGVKEQ